jgi:hypothetical protein
VPEVIAVCIVIARPIREQSVKVHNAPRKRRAKA